MNPSSATGDLAAIASALSGQYDVEREIGRGGMGVVYLARDRRLDRMVAIKTLPAQLADDGAVRERFLREARTAARLSHPNIVPIHRADEIAGQVFFVMGFVDGDSLAAQLQHGGPLSPRDAVPILRDVAAALGYAHKHGVVHRDVKTENILIESTTGRAMVTDFGIARVAEAAPLTATGQVLGTVYYLSPEQVSGDDIDQRSDIYALGVVGYAMLAGKFPFDGPLASAVLVAHVMKAPVPLAVATPNVPESLASIIDRCLAKDPASRFQSCDDLDAALSAAQGDANRVTGAATRSTSPLLSDSEAHAVFKRAAELQDMTGMQPRPAPIPMARDAERDAQRTSGFKTTNLREAAREAGIGEQYMRHALAERGLGPARSTPETEIRDLTPKRRFFLATPSRLEFEAIIQGEMASADFDLLIEAIRRGASDPGVIGTVGRSLNWSSQSRRGRQLEVSVFPRNGRTTIRVTESLGYTNGPIYGGIMGGAGGGGGGMVFAVTMANFHDPVFSFACWVAVAMGAFAVASTIAHSVAKDRRTALEKMIAELVVQAEDSIKSTAK
jgi:serine/threonine-protein kinase